MHAMMPGHGKDDENPDLPSGVFPDEEEPEDSAWFLAPPDEDVSRPPLPLADRTPPIDAREWRRAQADLAAELAHLALRFGALDERLRTAPAGWRQRLALAEAAELSWWCGDRVPADRLALWVGLHLAGVQGDPLALARAAWAVRRLQGGPGPEAGLAEFLGRQAGEGLAGRIADWQAAMAGIDDLHPFVQAGCGLHLWRLADVSGTGQAAEIEGPVVMARLAARAGRGGAAFLPVALAGAGGLRGGGPVVDRLARWLAGAEQATLTALLQLDRLEAWQARADGALKNLSGRTPPLLARLFSAFPFVSAPLAEAETGASRAAVQRNLDLMVAAGLVREVTGQGRYRLWSAKL